MPTLEVDGFGCHLPWIHLSHDWVLGSVSHLPHVAAFSLMNALQDLQEHMPEPVNLLEYSGGGLRDTTRIAASSPEMWRDICVANRQNLIKMIASYIQHLERFKTLVGTIRQ